MSDSTYARLSPIIIDSNKAMIQIIKGLLQQLGFSDIDTAFDGAEGLGLLEKKKYDLIISEWNMPNMDGLDLLKSVRSSKNLYLQNVPFIILTTESKKENILAAINAGVNNYIIKPPTLSIFKKKLDITLNIQ